MGNYTYGSSDHAHAVTETSGKSYGYDANGNQISRVIGSITYTLSYDAENRLVSVSWAIGSTNHSMTFVFDGDGSRVRSTLDGTTTTFAGTHYEVTGSAVTKYYYSGASRIAMRSSVGVRYIFGDHLGSASVTADRYGSSVTRQLYKPYGETRSSGSLPTKYQFTGQYSYSTEIGLMYYVARFFDSQLGRFISADTIVPQPGSPLDWDRYLFVRGNALRYTDPSGHFCVERQVGYICSMDADSNGWYYSGNPVQWEIDLFCYQSDSCSGSNVAWREVDASYLGNYLGYDPGTIRIPYHDDPGGPDDRFPWEYVANVAYNEHRMLHPHFVSQQWPRNEDWAYENWLATAVGIMQTPINRAWQNQSGSDLTYTYLDEYGNSVLCETPNQCASGGYAPPHREFDPAYDQFYVLAFVVIEMEVRIYQPYPDFIHQNESDVRGDGSDSVAFGPSGGPFNFYVVPIPAVR
jgi:RHS repeat-associated protein